MALREAMDEEDFGPIRIAPVLRRNGEAIWRLHRDRLELLFLRLGGRCKSDEERRDRNSGKLVPRGWVNHGAVLLVHAARAPGEPKPAFSLPPKRSCDRQRALSLSVAQERAPACCSFISRAMPQRSWDRLG